MLALNPATGIRPDIRQVAELEGMCCTGQKGSDASAREATMKMMAATQQLNSLRQLLLSIGDTVAADRVAETPHKLGRNTIVRGALQELCNTQQTAHRPRQSMSQTADRR